MYLRFFFWVMVVLLSMTTVLAVAPTHGYPVLQSDTLHKNSDRENITLYNVSTEDADGDVVKNIITWYINSSPYYELYLPFEAGSTSSYTKDYSGNGRDGTPYYVEWNETTGYDGFGAYKFNQSNNEINVSDNAVFSPVNNNMTVMLWAKKETDAPNTQGYMITKGEDATTFEWGIGSSNTFVNATLWQGGSPHGFVSHYFTVNDSQWHHYAFTIVYLTNLSFYVDGVLVNSTSSFTATMSDGNADIQIGGFDQTIADWEFNGSLDDVMIFSRVLSLAEIQDIYNNNTNIIRNTTTTVNDIWQGCITPVDDNNSVGTEKCSNKTYINGNTSFYCFFNESNYCGPGYLKLLGAENDTTGYNNAHAQNYSLETYDNSLCCTSDDGGELFFNCTRNPLFNLSDEDNAHAETYDFDTTGYNVTICMTKRPHNMSCLFKDVCTIDETCVLSLSNNSNGQNAHISDCTEPGWWRLCCLETNSVPNLVTLFSPPNDTVTYNRTINFTWLATTDPSSDPLTYQLNITFASAVDCGPDLLLNAGSNLSYSVGNLCTDQMINWSVRAFDGRDYGLWAQSWNLTVDSLISINLTTDNVDFGTMAAGMVNTTTTNDPSPLVVENDGNVLVDISVLGDGALWTNAGLNTSYLQSMADETAETGSFNVSASQTNWLNVSTDYETIISALNNSDATDTAQIEIRAEVPANEPAGDKETTITVRGVAY